MSATSSVLTEILFYYIWKLIFHLARKALMSHDKTKRNKNSLKFPYFVSFSDDLE